MPKTLSTVINIPNILGFYSAITFCLLYHLYSHFCRKKALQIINNSLEQDEVIIFDEDTPYELIKKVKPDIITKGGDYQSRDVVGNDLAEVIIIPFVNGYSTTGILEKING